MTKAEVAELLTVASSIDSRKVTREMVEAWHVVVSRVPYAVALAALRMHWAESAEWFVPAHVMMRRGRAERRVELEADRRAQVEWLDRAGITMADYAANVDRPGWLEAMQLTVASVEVRRGLER